ncbi:MAG: hypothetical protein M5R38_18345 [Candidatus Methylomirabilis sp.]|nr:hypothetical protein [Candidatus Methylomirabilis sp.]
MLAGVRSRWTIPRRCATVSAGCDLIQQPGDRVHRPGTVTLNRIMEIAAAQPAHHQIGIVRLAPEIVQRHDVHVLQPGDDLGLRFEPADEFGRVGVARQDDLDGDFALDSRLEGAIYRREPADADQLAQQIPFDLLAAEIAHTSPPHLSRYDIITRRLFCKEKRTRMLIPTGAFLTPARCGRITRPCVCPGPAASHRDRAAHCRRGRDYPPAPAAANRPDQGCWAAFAPRPGPDPARRVACHPRLLTGMF